jgi:hypothetical protein
VGSSFTGGERSLRQPGGFEPKICRPNRLSGLGAVSSEPLRRRSRKFGDAPFGRFGDASMQRSTLALQNGGVRRLLNESMAEPVGARTLADNETARDGVFQRFIDKAGVASRYRDNHVVGKLPADRGADLHNLFC